MLRIGRLKKVGTISVAAIVLATVSFTAAFALDGNGQRHHFLTTTNFSIAGTIYSSFSGTPPTTSCAGSPALFYPGVTRCVVLSVHNNLSLPIIVQRITTTLNPRYSVPSACSGSNLTLPTFSGALTVAGHSTADSPGLLISLNESDTNQDVCENYTYHFIYSGEAQYTDSTATVLTSSPDPATFGQPVAFTAKVNADNDESHSSVTVGSVSFYKCATVTCASTTLLGTASIRVGGMSTFITSSLSIGSIYVEAIFGGSSSDYTGSVSNVVDQVVTSALVATSTSLTSSPDPSVLGSPVTLRAVVTRPTSSIGLNGTVSFYVGTPSGTHTLLGTTALSGPDAYLVVPSLLVGTDSLYAIYSGDANFAESTSPVIDQLVVARPLDCAGNYNSWYIAADSSIVDGSNGNDFFYAPQGSYQFYSQNGNNCLFTGDGNDWFHVGDGHDVVHCGNGNNNIWLGNGNDDVAVGDGSNDINTGYGNDVLSIGNGFHNQVLVGNGADDITIGDGSYNTITLGSGGDSVIVQGGSHDTIFGGNGSETIDFGAGHDNGYVGVAHHTNICHLPAPPTSWHGNVAVYYGDSITNCTVVTP